MYIERGVSDRGPFANLSVNNDSRLIAIDFFKALERESGHLGLRELKNGMLKIKVQWRWEKK